MSTSPSIQHSNTSNRFFAVTPSRLAAVVEHDLSRAELLVWAAVEMGAKPRRPVPFSLEKLAENLHLSADTVRRAVRRLLSLGLVAGFKKANTHHLAPAAGAWEGSGEKPTLAPVPGRQGSTFSPTADQREADAGAGSPSEKPTLAPVSVPGNADGEPAAAVTQTYTSPERKERLDLSLCPVARQLVDDWNVFPKVAVDLVERFGADHVGQVMAWGAWLKSKGKLRSLGWVYQALVRGWAVPDGFQRATKAPTPHRQPADTPKPSKVEETPSTPESQLATIKQMLASPVAAVRRMGERFAAEWGVSLEAARAV